MRLSQQIEQLTPELWEVRLTWYPGWFLKLFRVKTVQEIYHGQGEEWELALPAGWQRVAEGTIKKLVIETWRCHRAEQELEQILQKLRQDVAAP